MTAALAVAALVLPLAAQAHEIESDRLQDARRQVAAITRELNEVAGVRQQAATEVTATRQRLAAVEASVNAAAVALERQQLVVDQAREELDTLERRAADMRARLADRAASMYKQGPAVGLSAILASDDIEAALDRSAFIGIVTRAEETALERVGVAQIDVRTQRQRFEQEREHLAALKQEQEALRAEVAHVLDHRLVRLAQVGSRVEELEHRKEDLEADARRLTNLLQARQQRSRGVGPPSTSGYVWPLCGRVTSGFGRRWGRMHSGIDVDGSTGDPIVAARSGVVIFAGWDGGYGRHVVIDHGDGVATSYAHQSVIAVSQGQRVERGQRIGSVGSTGNSTGSHLHFEIRVNSGAVNPMRFLSRGC